MQSSADLPVVGTVLQIFLVDLLLSGDNAVIVGLASHSLPRRQMRAAISVGIAFAVVLRVFLAALASFLLAIPGLKLIGGLALIVIAVKLASGGGPRLLGRPVATGAHKPHDLSSAVFIIVAADLIMSFDNVVAVAAIARGNILYLVFGLLLSIPFLMWGSTVIAILLRRYKPLVVIGGMLVGWIAGGLAIADPLIADWVNREAPALPIVVPVLAALYVFFEARFDKKNLQEVATPSRPLPEILAVGPVAEGNNIADRRVGAREVERSHSLAPDQRGTGMAFAKRLWARRAFSSIGTAPKEPEAEFIAPSIDQAVAAGALILVATTNPFEQGEIARALTKFGYAAEFARDGKQALAMLESRRYGLLIVDCYMPELDGYQLTQRVREAEATIQAHLAIIGLLGYVSDLQGPAKCRAAGMDDSVSKAAFAKNIDRIVARWLPAATGIRRPTARSDDIAVAENHS